MIIELDMSSSTPIYVQLRNQIVKGIGKGELKTGEKLPTIRQLASDAGVNTMTVNKAYQILEMRDLSVQTDGSALLCQNPSQMIQISLKIWNQSLSF